MIAAKLNGNIVVNTIVVDDVPDGYVVCSEWVGIGMDINTPQPSTVPAAADDPMQKLKVFLAANPDVASLLT
jgi:hypothetical protein